MNETEMKLKDVKQKKQDFNLLLHINDLILQDSCKDMDMIKKFSTSKIGPSVELLKKLIRPESTKP